MTTAITVPGQNASPGIRKAAILMIALGDEASIELGRHLREDELARIGEEIARMGPVPRRESNTVLQEFCALLDLPPALRGSPQFAERLVVGVLGTDNASRVLDRIRSAVTAGDSTKVDAIRKLDPQSLAAFLHGEHPQTVAVIAANLETQQAGALLIALPGGVRAEVARRMAKVDRVSPEVLARIADLIGQKVQTQSKADRPPSGGAKGVADVLSSLGDAASDEILASIESADPSTASGIRQFVFGFEDILGIDQQGMKLVLATVDRKVLTVALKGTGEQLRAHFAQGMSKRAAEMLHEDMEALGPVRIRDVENARQQVIAIVKQFRSEGAISAGSGSEESYVD
jgi:flagellar motor switch protein FliG